MKKNNNTKNNNRTAIKSILELKFSDLKSVGTTPEQNWAAQHSLDIGKSLNNQAGIYLLFNNNTELFYIGSSKNLKKRLYEYTTPSYLDTLEKKGNSYIIRSLLAHGHNAFTIKILEFIELASDLTEKEKKALIFSREQHYIDTLKPKYNINLIAGSNKGRIYDKKVRAKMSKAKKGLPSHRKGSKHNLESLDLMVANSGRRKTVYVYNTEGVLWKKFLNIQKAALATGVSRKTIAKYAGSPTLLMGLKKTDTAALTAGQAERLYHIFSFDLFSDPKVLLKITRPRVHDSSTVSLSALKEEKKNSNLGTGAGKLVYVYNLDGSYYKSFNSMRDAAKDTGVTTKMILKYSDRNPPVLRDNKYYFSFKHNFNKAPLF